MDEQTNSSAIGAESAGGQSVSENLQQFIEGAGEQAGEVVTKQVHFELDLGEMIRKAVKDEIAKILQESGAAVEVAPSVFDGLHRRVKALEDDLEAQGLLTRKATVDEPAEASS